MLTRRTLVIAGAALAAGMGRGSAAPASTLRLGVLSDQSGPYRDNGGLGSLACVQQAVADFVAHTPLAVEIVSADHGGKPDMGLAIARKSWDYYKVLATVPPGEAWRPLAGGACPFVKS